MPALTFQVGFLPLKSEISFSFCHVFLQNINQHCFQHRHSDLQFWRCLVPWPHTSPTEALQGAGRSLCLLQFSSPQADSLQLPCSTHWEPLSTLSSQESPRSLSGAGSSVRMLFSARAKQVASCPRVGFPVDLGMQAYVIYWDAPLKKSLGYWAGVSGIDQTHGCNRDMKKPSNACSKVDNLTHSGNTWEESLSWRVTLEQVGCRSAGRAGLFP